MQQAGYVDGFNGVQVRATDFWTTSDIRIKDNIVPLVNARERLFSTVTGVTFDKNGIASMGLIAQDVQKEFPMAVIETAEFVPGTDSKILTVNYQSIIAPVIEAERENYEDIKKLQAENQQLKTDFAALNEKFEALMKKLG